MEVSNGGCSRVGTTEGRTGGELEAGWRGPTYLLLLLLDPLPLSVLLLPGVILDEASIVVPRGVEFALCLVELGLEFELAGLSGPQPALEIMLQEKVRASHGRWRF